MDVGKEFSSWESFQNALDQYSQENKVVYVVGTCKPVETANKNELLLHKFPVRFKYCFARMVCKHFGSYSSKSQGQRPNQRTCKTGCTSSIMVSVNKKRTSLVIKEANLQHNHTVSESIFSSYPQTRRLQGDERRMASVLLRAGVPLLRVQEFVCHACHKDPTVKDLQNLRSSTLKASAHSASSSDGVEVEELAFLSDVDKLMAEDSGSIVEIINFDLVPGAIYIQTSSMIEATRAAGSGLLQVITHSLNKGKISVVSVVGLDAKEDPQVLALCVIMVISDTALRCFFEAFVRNNSTFCDCVKGIVLDCSKENAEFFQQLIPQAHLAWSRSYVLGSFAEIAASISNNVEQHLQLLKHLMDAGTEEAYEQNLKCLLNSMKVAHYKEFLNTWDGSKELWALHEMSSFPCLQHQKASIETHFLSTLKIFLKPQMTSSELIRALLRFVRNEDPGELEAGKSFSFEFDSSCKLYRELCFHNAYRATECQIAISLSSVYEIKQQADMIFIKRKDSEEEFILNIQGSKCTCPYFLREELPCQHIFAWLKCSGKSLFDESLIPVKRQVFGTAITLDTIAESLAQGQVPSSLEHDERIKELQNILKDVLASACAHSYQQMGRDIALLRQVLVLMRTCSTYDANVVITKNGSHDAEVAPQVLSHEASEAVPSTAKRPGRPPGKRGRGRPSNKEKLLRMMQEQEKAHHLPAHDLTSTTAAKRSKLEEEVSSPSSSVLSPRHNLRKNIKHKFVTREANERIAPVNADISDAYEEGENFVASGSVSVMQVEEDESKVVTSVLNSDRTELYRAVLPKALLMAENSLSGAAVGKQSLQTNLTSNENQSQIRSVSDSKRQHFLGDKRKQDDCDDVNYDDSCSSSEDDSDDDSSNHESAEERRERRKGELAVYMSEFSPDFVNEILQSVSLMDSPEEREQRGSALDGELSGRYPSEVLFDSCEDNVEVDFLSSYIANVCPEMDQYTYQVASCLFRKANLLGEPIVDVLQCLSFWPNHLPAFPLARPFEGEVMLNPGQTLTLCGHKLDQEDMDSIRPGKEISSETVHAYLEILAQKYSGKMFVLPFSVVHVWRNGSYTDMLFKKVHFKTFDYLVLPIHCGGEFTALERESGDILQPCWMALVADVKTKSVSVLNPRTEHRYAIAANGYMLQWRRYMQIRSVHTREMLSAWTTKHVECNKMDKEGFSAVMLLMNIEALICNVHPAVMHPKIHSSRYRHHIAACLRDMDWQTTVLCVGGPECQRMAARDADWLQCENCRAWWHRACATAGSDEMGGINRERPGKAGIFYCTSCRQRIQALKGEGGRDERQAEQREEDEEHAQEEENQEEEEGEEEFEEEDEIEEGREDGEEVMQIEEVQEEEEDEERSKDLILRTVETDEAEK